MPAEPYRGAIDLDSAQPVYDEAMRRDTFIYRTPEGDTVIRGADEKLYPINPETAGQYAESEEGQLAQARLLPILEGAF